MSQNKKEQPVFEVGKMIWPSVSNVGGNPAGREAEKELRQLFTEFAEYVAKNLEENGIPRFVFPLFRPFNAVFGVTQNQIIVIVAPLSGGLATLRFMDWKDAPGINLEQAVAGVRQQLGWRDISAFHIPSSMMYRDSLDRQGELKQLAKDFAERIKEDLLHQQRKVAFHPIFRTPLEELETDPSLCFVLMPFKPEFNRIYENILQPAIREAGLNPLRADEIFSPTPIVEDVWAHIARSRLIIADVTDKNPNVFYELGLAHAIGIPVIIITQNKEDVPFDVAYIRYLIYTDNEVGWRKLQKDLTKAVSSIIAG